MYNTEIIEDCINEYERLFGERLSSEEAIELLDAVKAFTQTEQGRIFTSKLDRRYEAFGLFIRLPQLNADIS